MRLLVLAALPLLLAACVTSRSAAPPPVVTVEDLDARGEDEHFTFYSLRENRVVPLADSASTE